MLLERSARYPYNRDDDLEVEPSLLDKDKLMLRQSVSTVPQKQYILWCSVTKVTLYNTRQKFQ